MTANQTQPEKEVLAAAAPAAEPSAPAAEPSAPPAEPSASTSHSLHMRWWGWLLSAATIIGVFACIAFPPQAATPSLSVPFEADSAAIVRDPSVTELTADTILNAYNNSVPKTVLMFNEQTLRIDGFLSATGADDTGRYVELAAHADDMSAAEAVRFYLSDALYKQAAAAPPHSELLITGVCRVHQPEEELSLSFDSCTLVQVVP